MRRRGGRWGALVVGICLVAGGGCGSDAASGDGDATTLTSATDATATGATDGTGSATGATDGTGSATGATDSASTATGATDTATDSDVTPPVGVCTPPIELADTSSPTHVIGTGTPASCTSAALVAAAAQGGTIVFDCGAAPVTIALDATLEPPIDTDTIIDGGGRVTLDARGARRHVYFSHPDWMNNPTRLVLQRLRFVGGNAPRGTLFPQDPARPLCAWGYKEGAGGSVYVRNGVLHVLECTFEGNVAAPVGPDIAGGAIFAVGVPEVVIVRSVFLNNRASNGGAVGMLFANPDIYDSHFEGNRAEGTGQNYVEPGCPMFNHDEQGGAGGNSGAVVFDGLNDDGDPFEICGSVFRDNRANELGGALFRTPNAGVRAMVIDRSVFDSNTARMGGVSFILDHQVTVRASTFMHNRAGVLIDGSPAQGIFGGLWLVRSTLDLVNSTFVDHDPLAGLDVEGGGATVVNATFVESRISSGLDVRNSLFVDTDCSNTAGGSHNLQWPSGTACAQGTTFADPELGALGDHGGPTPTLVPGAAAAGIGADCPAVDQRGAARPTASCSAGAVEP